MIQNKSKKYNLKKRISLFIGVTLIIMGISLILLGDTFTYAPYLFMISGIFIIIFTRYNINSDQLLIVSFFIMYFIISFFFEVIVKSYQFKIKVPQHQNKFYFIAANNYLKWGDYFFTFFKPKIININLTDDKVYYLSRGLPNNIDFDVDFIAKQGYTISKNYRGNYKFIILTPLKINVENLIYNESKYMLYNKIDSNNKLNKKLIEYKLDSIEKNGFY